MEKTNQYLLRLEKKSKIALILSYIIPTVLLFGLVYQLSYLSLNDFLYGILLFFIQILIMLLSKPIGKLLLKWKFSVEASSGLLSLIGLYSGYVFIELNKSSLLLSIVAMLVHLSFVSYLYVYEYKVIKELVNE